MNIELVKLPYAEDALAPVISKQTIEFHHGKHLAGYVNTLSTLVKGTEFEGKSVEEIVKSAPQGPIFNNAGQIFNHTFFFTQFRAPKADNAPTGKIAELINAQFGSYDAFVKEFNNACITLFGSGWAWLALDKDGKLVISKESNAGNPLTVGQKPLLTVDVWEHSYYLDYQNRRADHVASIWQIINWDVINERLECKCCCEK